MYVLYYLYFLKKRKNERRKTGGHERGEERKEMAGMKEGKREKASQWTDSKTITLFSISQELIISKLYTIYITF